MSVHRLKPSVPAHRYDANTKDLHRAAFVNLLDAYQRFNDVSHLIPAADIAGIEIALNTALLYTIYSRPHAIRNKQHRVLMGMPAANSEGVGQ